MFVIGNLLFAVATILRIILTLYMWVIIIAALISWVNPDPYNPIVRFLYAVTDPVLSRIRRFVSFRIGVDISPIIAILIILFLQHFVVQSLFDLANKLR